MSKHNLLMAMILVHVFSVYVFGLAIATSRSTRSVGAPYHYVSYYEILHSVCVCVFAIATWKSNSKITCNSLFYGYQTNFIHYWAHSLWVNKHVCLIKCSTNSAIDECEYDVLKWLGKGWWTRSISKPDVGWCLYMCLCVNDVKNGRDGDIGDIVYSPNSDISGTAI